MADREKTGINWGLAAALTLIGVAFLFWSLLIDGFTDQGWSAVFVEVGAGIALIAFIVVAERNLFRRIRSVAQSAATEAAERTTADLERRLVSLENLDEQAAAERQKRRQEEMAAVAEVIEGDLNLEAVLDLIAMGFEDGLFASSEYMAFKVRTSANPGCHVLYFYPGRALNAVFIDFNRIRLEADFETGHLLPKPTRTAVMWSGDKDAGQISSDLEAILERINEPSHGFSLAHALSSLVSSYECMRSARKAPADSPKRLNGELTVLINDRWAFTTYGLEDLESATAYRAEPDMTRRVFGPKLTGPPAAEKTPGWDEAMTWMENRENAVFELPPF